MQRHWVILIAVVAFIAGLWAAPTVYRWQAPPPPESIPDTGGGAQIPFVVSTPSAADRDLPALSQLYERLSPCVVNIAVLGAGQQGSRRLGMDSYVPLRESRGSGFILTPDGSVLTNHHVVAGARRVQVLLADGRSYPASVVGSHEATDLALLQIDSDEALALQPAVLGNSDELQVGEWVFAIGNPFGLHHSLTTGIVSYIGRPAGDEGLLFDFIQTDTAINPGNSGGPLFNLAGEVIGINSAILGDAEGIGFSIPVDIARTVVPVLREKGEFRRGYLGVSLAAAHPEHSGGGIPLAAVHDGTPASAAGLQAGDLLLRLGGQPLTDTRDVPRFVGLTPPGTPVEVAFQRGGEALSTTVVVGDFEELGRLHELPIPSLGINVRAASEDDRRAGRLAARQGGLTVTGVEPGGPASRSLSPGDIIVELDYESVLDPEAFAAQLQQSGRHLLLISRRGAVFPLWVR
jgi:serine protease Do